MRKFVAAAGAMQRDGWWWRDEDVSNKQIRRGFLREMIARRLGWETPARTPHQPATGLAPARLESER